MVRTATSSLLIRTLRPFCLVGQKEPILLAAVLLFHGVSASGNGLLPAAAWEPRIFGACVWEGVLGDEGFS